MPITTSTRADAKPAAKLLTLGFSDGRYRKPEPAECGGMMNMSYLPGGRFVPEFVVFGFSPWGGGGGGAPLMASGHLEAESGVCAVEKYVVLKQRELGKVQRPRKQTLGI